MLDQVDKKFVIKLIFNAVCGVKHKTNSLHTQLEKNYYSVQNYY